MAAHIQGSFISGGGKKDPLMSEEEIERRKNYVDFIAADAERISKVKEIVLKNVSELTSAFFEHLAKFPETKGLFSATHLLEDAKRMKKEHLIGLFSGEYGQNYVNERLNLARIYSRAGIDTKIFIGAFLMLIRNIGKKIFKEFKGSPEEELEIFLSIQKIAFFDLGLIIDFIVSDREWMIGQQQEAIRELSTPVLQLRDRLLILPIVGMIDSYRARLMTENLLKAIRSNRARVVVIDITGVVSVDSKVANHLVQTVSASNLMGAKVIVTGLSAEIAQTLVTLGVETSILNTVGDLQGGIEEAERFLGYTITYSKITYSSEKDGNSLAIE